MHWFSIQFSIVLFLQPLELEVILCGLSLICILLLGRNHYFLMRPVIEL